MEEKKNHTLLWKIKLNERKGKYRFINKASGVSIDVCIHVHVHYVCVCLSVPVCVYVSVCITCVCGSVTVDCIMYMFNYELVQYVLFV